MKTEHRPDARPHGTITLSFLSFEISLQSSHVLMELKKKTLGRFHSKQETVDFKSSRKCDSLGNCVDGFFF